MCQKLRAIYRKKAAYIKQDHEERTNRFLAHADTIYIESMDYRALQKRARDTSRKEEASPVKQKDGTVRLIRKFKKKKRFGRSLNNRAPASFARSFNVSCVFARSSGRIPSKRLVACR